jgi:predicted TIM-barrel fold metal-dependent hydrolase
MTEASRAFVPKAPTIPAQRRDTRPPGEKFPPHACDCHVHIFGPQQQYPHAPNPGYIPNEASVEELLAMMAIIGCERAVIVQPSYYGTDNSCTVDAVIAGKGRFRGVASIDPAIADVELDALHRRGIRGVRLNLKAINGKTSVDHLKRVAQRVARLGWHVQLYFYADTMADIDGELAALPVEVVIDHIGYIKASDGLQGPGFQMLVRLARTGRAWFKLSAPYRQSNQPPFFPDVAPFARALFEIVPDRCVWATDWPHASRNDTGIIRVPNDGELADALIDWFPDAADRKRILVNNPARLYGFA